MKKKNLFAMFLITVGVAAITSSCTQTLSDVASTAALSNTAGDESQAAVISDNIDNEVDTYVTTAALNGSNAVIAATGEVEANGPTVTIDHPDSTNFPKVFTIDYGTTGIQGKRGNILKGKLIVVVSNNMWKAGSTKTVTFDGFSINDNSVTGSKVLTYNGLNSSAHPYWTIAVNDTINRGDTATVVWISNRTREWKNDNGTPYIKYDDFYSISGSSNGVNAKGKAYTILIEANKPLIIGGGWPFFVKGSQTVTSEDRTAVIDFGDGTPDRLATVTVNGKTKEITLKK